MLVCVPGFPGHLFYAPGVNFGQIGGLIPLCRTVDGGVNWSIVPGTNYITNVAIGKAKPGNLYPAVYIAGSLRGFPYDWGVYRRCLVNFLLMGKPYNQNCEAVI